MVDKANYIQRLKKLYELKNKKTLSDELAFEYFENLITLVSAVTSCHDIDKIVLPEKHERRENV